MRDLTEAQKNVIRRAQKVLNLANGTSNEHEAETAQLMVQKMLAEYDLSISDLSPEEIKKSTCDEHVIDLLPGDVPRWVIGLASVMMNVYEVRCVKENAAEDSLGEYAFNFIGLEPYATIAAQSFVTVYRHLIFKQMPLKYGKRKTEDYREGFVEGLYQKLMTQKREHEAAAASSCTALVLARKQVQDEYVHNRYPRLRNTKVARSRHAVDPEAYNNGHKAGSEYTVTPGVRRGATQKAVA